MLAICSKINPVEKHLPTDILKLLADAQLPKQLAVWLRYKALYAIHTLDLPDQNKTDDEQIKAIAKEENRAVISKDRDFPDAYILKKEPRKPIQIKTGNSSNEELLKIFELNLPVILELIQNNNLVEVGWHEIVSRR
jgi:predicted nuclease of predicted toxin-antitoxin system